MSFQQLPSVTECTIKSEGLSLDTCTEDSFPIKTIVVGNLSSNVAKEKLKEHFETFGTVDSITIKTNGTKDTSCCEAYVTFTEPQLDTKILKESLHCSLGKRVRVEADDSCHESQRRKIYIISDDSDKNQNQLSILNLNDCCLHHIASFLELPEIVCLAKTCRHLERSMEPVFALYTNYDTKLLSGWTPLGISELLSRIGPYVRNVRCVNNELLEKNFMDLLIKYCRNVETLDLTECYNCDKSVLKEIIRNFRKLKRLILKNCHVTDDINAVLYSCRNLETLDLPYNLRFSGKYLDRLNNLKTLNLSGCGRGYRVYSNYIINLWMKTNLISLNLEGCEFLESSSTEILASTQTKLENLSISYTYEATNLLPLATLRGLKRLRIDCCYNECDEFFQELAIHRDEELEVLEILNYEFNRKLEMAIFSLSNLKVLTMYNYQVITPIFLTDLATIPLECLFIHPIMPVDNEGMLNLIRDSENIKEIFIFDRSGAGQRQLVQTAFQVLKTKMKKHPLNLVTNKASLVNGIIVRGSNDSFKRRKVKEIMKQYAYPF